MMVKINDEDDDDDDDVGQIKSIRLTINKKKSLSLFI